MSFYILSRLDSVCRGLAYAILYLITPWQYPPRLGMLFYILSRLGSIRRRTNLQKPKLRKLKSKEKSSTAKAQAPKTRATKAQVEQIETCRRAGVRGTLWIC